MRLANAVAVAAVLCAGSAVQSQTASSETPQQVPSASIHGIQKQQSHTSGVEILSDTEGVDVGPYLRQWIHITVGTLVKIAPTEANKVSLQPGAVAVRFKILPSGKIMDGGMVLEERSGQSELDKIAWDAVATSAYSPLPEQFHGPYLELRWHLVYKGHQAK